MFGWPTFVFAEVHILNDRRVVCATLGSWLATPMFVTLTYLHNNTVA